MPPILLVDDETVQPVPPVLAEITTAALTGPDRLVASIAGQPVATFTVGARTVAVKGQARSFTENKRVGAGTEEVFDRTRSSRWGMSPTYGEWSLPVGGVTTDYTVDGSSARVLVNTTNVSRYTTLRDTFTGFTARMQFTTDSAPAGASNSMSLVGDYADTSNHYRARLTLTTSGLVQLAVDRVQAGTTTTIGANTQVGTGYTPGQLWWIEMQHLGSALRARAWLDGTTPPAVWTHDLTDSTFTAGRVGIRAFTSTGATNTPTFVVSEIQISTGNWVSPPVVTHDTWVRLLAEPFTAWSPGVEAWLRAALVDTSPDILAYAMAYVTGSPSVLDPRLPAGRQVLGQAKYGPNNTDGTRVEGADFNDYIRVGWSYPNLVTPTTDINEIAQQYCLDCSGFVRILFGYWGGMPMSLTDPADASGVNIPRRAVLIGPSGPGVLVATGTTSPPVLSGMQIGDVVAFNADAADDVAGDDSGDVEQTDDHVGVYLGQDAGNNYLFLSSRKTTNGPTFGPLGGSSYLNGSGFWAQSLRHIRRF